MTRFLGLSLFIAISASNTLLHAQSSAHRPGIKRNDRNHTPTAAALVERYINAIGGRAAWIRIKTHLGTGSIQVLPMTDIGTFETYSRAPNQTCGVMKLVRLGEFRSGFDGERGWSQNPRDGFKYSPPEKQAADKRNSDFYQYMHFKKHFADAKVTDIEEVEGSSAYVIEATPVGEDEPERIYFDVHTHLLVRHDTIDRDSKGEKTQSIAYFSDYRDVDGIKVAFNIRLVRGSVTMLMKIKEVKNNVDIDDSMFAPPTK